MELSNVSNVSFTANRFNLKRKSNIRKNNSRRNKIITAGLITAGTAAGILLISKKTNIFNNLFEKVKSINPFKKNVSLYNDKFSYGFADSQKSQTTVPSIAKVENEPLRIEGSVDGIQKTTSITMPLEEKKQPEIVILEAEKTMQSGENVIEKEQSAVEFKDENVTESVRRTRRSERYKTSSQNELSEKKETQKDAQDKLRNMLDENDAVLQETKTPADSYAAKLNKSEIETEISRQANIDFITKQMEENPDFYDHFGLDDELLDKFYSLNPNLVKEIDDSWFLSYLLAPQKALKATINELYNGYPKNGAIMAKLKSTILKNSKKTLEEEKLVRKLNLHRNVGNLLSKQERIQKLQELEEKFTPEDLHKIFNSEDTKASTKLLKWMMGFNTKEESQLLLDSIKISC